MAFDDTRDRGTSRPSIPCPESFLSPYDYCFMAFLLVFTAIFRPRPETEPPATPPPQASAPSPRSTDPGEVPSKPAIATTPRPGRNEIPDEMEAAKSTSER